MLTVSVIIEDILTVKFTQMPKPVYYNPRQHIRDIPSAGVSVAGAVKAMPAWITRLMGFLCLVLALTGAVRAAPLAVTVSVLPQKRFVEKVGKEHVAVQVLVGPGRSPATYEPSPRQMAHLSRSRVYFRIGVPFEDVWLKRIQAANPQLRVVDTRQGVQLRHLEAHGHDHPASGMPDPHVWTSPPLVKRMIATIRDALTALDPTHGADYQANYLSFANELEVLDADIRHILEPVQRRRFMVFHPSWGYFADAYGLQQVAIEVEGKDPGARSLTRIIEQARREGVGAVFVQSQFSRRTAETVARALDARVVAVDPLAEDYAENLRRVARALAEALDG